MAMRLGTSLGMALVVVVVAACAPSPEPRGAGSIEVAEPKQDAAEKAGPGSSGAPPSRSAPRGPSVDPCVGCEAEERVCVAYPDDDDCEPGDPNDRCPTPRPCPERCCPGLEHDETDE